MHHKTPNLLPKIRRTNWPAYVFCGLSCSLATRAEAHQNMFKNNGRLYKSAHFLGRGDTGIAIADNDDAIFYNPAGIAYGKGIYKKTVLLSPAAEVSSATKDLARQLGAEDADAVAAVRNQVGKPNHFGFNNFTGLVLRRAALGLVASGSGDLLAYKSPDAGALEVIDAAAEQNVGLTFSLAESFWNDTLLLGVTTKYLQRSRGEASVGIAEADTIKNKFEDTSNFFGIGEGTGADLGLMLRSSGNGRLNPSFGLTVTDIGDTYIQPNEPTKVNLDLKQTINAGFAIEPGTKFSKFRLLLDYRDLASRLNNNWRKKLSLGGEISVKDMIGLSGGLHQGGPSLGLYTDLYVVRLDLGMYAEEVGRRVGDYTDRRFFARIKIGF